MYVEESLSKVVTVMNPFGNAWFGFVINRVPFIENGLVTVVIGGASVRLPHQGTKKKLELAYNYKHLGHSNLK